MSLVLHHHLPVSVKNQTAKTRNYIKVYDISIYTAAEANKLSRPATLHPSLGQIEKRGTSCPPRLHSLKKSVKEKEMG
jgi:hypothetical protein